MCIPIYFTTHTSYWRITVVVLTKIGNITEMEDTVEREEEGDITDTEDVDNIVARVDR